MSHPANAPSAIDLLSALGVGLPVFVLIDPMVGEPLSFEFQEDSDQSALMHAREDTWQRTVHRVDLAPAIELPMHLHPYLVALQDGADPWLELTLEMAHVERQQSLEGGLAGSGAAVHRIGGWLTSARHPSELASHLGGLMRVPPGVQTTARYLRLADRRVVDWLRQVVGSQRIGAALGPVRQWVYLDPLGQLEVLQQNPQADLTWRLERSEWTELMLGPKVHRTLARWQGVAADAALRPTNKASLYRLVLMALGEADKAATRWPMRFTQPCDFEAWAALFLLHSGLAQRSEVIQLLDAAAEPGTNAESLDELCGALHSLCGSPEPSQPDVAST